MKKILKHLAPVIASLGVSLAGSAHSEPVVTLKLADHMPLTHPASKLMTQAFILEVEQRSKGAIEIKHFPAQQLAKAAGMYDAVRNKVADIGFVSMPTAAKSMPLSTVIGLPGLYTDVPKGVAAFEKLMANELSGPEYKKNNMHPLLAAATPHAQILLTKGGPLESLDQLKGLKLRASGSEAELLAKELGATPVPLSPADTYLAAERGTVDGVMMNPQSSFSYKISGLLSSATTDAALGTAAYVLMMNGDVWKGLSKEHQDIMTAAAGAVGPNAVAKFSAGDAAASKKLADAGVKTYEMPPALKSGVSAATARVQDEWVKQLSARGLPAADILSAYKRYLAEQ